MFLPPLSTSAFAFRRRLNFSLCFGRLCPFSLSLDVYTRSWQCLVRARDAGQLPEVCDEPRTKLFDCYASSLDPAVSLSLSRLERELFCTVFHTLSLLRCVCLTLSFYLFPLFLSHVSQAFAAFSRCRENNPAQWEEKCAEENRRLQQAYANEVFLHPGRLSAQEAAHDCRARNCSAP